MRFSDFMGKVNIDNKLNPIIDKGFEKKQNKPKKKPMNIILKSLIILLVTIAVVGFLFVVLKHTDVLSVRYESVINYFYLLQDWIMKLPYKWLIVLAFFLIYFIKMYIPILPLSVVCVIAGAFCPYWWMSLSVNMLGLAMGFAMKYRTGKKQGDGYMQNLLKKTNKNVKMALEIGGIGGYGMLFAFRLFPIFPINFISRLYGTNKDVHFGFYMFVSLVGIFPRTFVYTYLGRQIFDPFSPQFVTLLIIMACAVGLSTFVINIIFYIRRNEGMLVSNDGEI